MNIDIAIVVTFLVITLIVGLSHGQKVKGIKDYALGGRNFSTAALVATIVATWASGSGFFVTLSKTYSDGFYYMFASIGIGISFLITSLVLVPRMGEFLGKTSIAEAMGDLYGSKVRMITAITGTIGAAGSIAVQFKVFGGVFSYFMDMPASFAIIASGAIATLYSSFGGIRAVTFTDVLQFFAFGVIIPLLGFLIWNQFYYNGYSVEAALANPKFDMSVLFNSANDDFWAFIVLFVYFTIPTSSAPMFQRVAIGNNVEQVKKAFLIAGIFLIFTKFIIAWIPFLIYTLNPDIDSNQLLGYIVDTFSFTGLKGLIIVAIIAFAMSTADSRINSASVLFTNDIYGLFAGEPKREILVSRLFATMLGVIAITFALVETDLLGIVVFANSFYYPLVTPPFILTVMGFRSSPKSVLIGMMAGLFVTISWKFLPIEFANVSQKIVGVLLAMLCNALFLLGSHYVLKQPGGWVGVKDRRYLDEEKIRKQKKWDKFVDSVYNFNFINYCKNYVPKNNSVYVYFSILCIVMTYTTMFMTPSVHLLQNDEILVFSYVSVLFVSVSFIVLSSFPLRAKKKIFFQLSGV